jgi:serine/threonine protein kinase
MGVELVKIRDGKEEVVISKEKFDEDEKIEESLEAYNVLKILGRGEQNCLTQKVYSKKNNKIYIMKEIKMSLLSEERKKQLIDVLNTLKNNECPNIIKHFTFFQENDNLYIINEFAKNGDLQEFLKTYKTIGENIDRKLIFHIFLQCIKSLEYLHKKNIIHRDIRLENFLIADNWVVKLANFKNAILLNDKEKRLQDQVGGVLYRSPEMNDSNSNYGKKTDIYSLGVVFHQLLYHDYPDSKIYKKKIINENYNIPNILKQIIKLMLDDEEKRPDTNYLYTAFLHSYINNAAKNTSIKSIIRCISAYQNFTSDIEGKKNNFQKRKKTPFSLYYIKILESLEEIDTSGKILESLEKDDKFNFESLKQNDKFQKILESLKQNDEYEKILESIKLEQKDKFKENLESINGKGIINFNFLINVLRDLIIENYAKGNDNMQEINPILVLKCLLEKLNREASDDFNLPSFTNELNKYIKKNNINEDFKDFKEKYYPPVYKYFAGVLETKRVCQSCKNNNNSCNYSLLPYLEFDLDICPKIAKDNKNKKEVFLEWCKTQTKHKSKKHINCNKCKSPILQEYKTFKDFQYNLIIAINRGEDYHNTESEMFEDISEIINLGNYIYKLIGLVKRKVDSKGEESFISIYLDHSKNTWILSDDNEIKVIKDPNYYEGIIILLFYSLVKIEKEEKKEEEEEEEEED